MIGYPFHDNFVSKKFFGSHSLHDTRKGEQVHKTFYSSLFREKSCAPNFLDGEHFVHQTKKRCTNSFWAFLVHRDSFRRLKKRLYIGKNTNNNGNEKIVIIAYFYNIWAFFVCTIYFDGAHNSALFCVGSSILFTLFTLSPMGNIRCVLYFFFHFGSAAVICSGVLMQWISKPLPVAPPSALLSRIFLPKFFNSIPRFIKSL